MLYLTRAKPVNACATIITKKSMYDIFWSTLYLATCGLLSLK